MCHCGDWIWIIGLLAIKSISIKESEIKKTTTKNRNKKKKKNLTTTVWVRRGKGLNQI